MESGERAFSAVRIGIEIRTVDFDAHAVLRFYLRIEHFIHRGAVHGVLDEFILNLKGILVFLSVVCTPVDDIVVNSKSA